VLNTGATMAERRRERHGDGAVLDAPACKRLLLACVGARSGLCIVEQPQRLGLPLLYVCA
jgi:hypothetical protein